MRRHRPFSDDHRPSRRRWGILAAGGTGVASAAILLAGVLGTATAGAAATPATIQDGSQGAVVRTWQADLDRVLPARQAVTVDGIFGARTRGATETFQTDRHIGVDGIVGPITWNAMLTLLSPAAAGLPECTTGQLRVSLGAGQGTAGSVIVPLTLTNVSGSTCTTDGYPGVSYVTGHAGTQVGRPAVRQPTVPPRPVVLAPGHGATALVQEVDAYNFPTAACRPTATRGLRVYPPDQRLALFAPAAGVGCASTAVYALTVEALQPAS